MTVVFQDVTISNFMSFGQKPTSFKLNEGKSIAIRGRNLDVQASGNESGNGAGKTTLINAVVFALFGKGIDKIKSDEFINLVNGKRLVVELTFTKGNSLYKIKRGRKPNVVELYESVDGEWASYTLDAMRNTDQAIEDIIGYSYDNFMASVFLSSHRQSFLAMGSADQRSMIETMLSLDTFALRAEALKLMRSDVQSELKILEKDLDRAIRNNEQLDHDIQRFKELSRKFEEDKAKEIQTLTASIEKIKKIDFVHCSDLLIRYDELKQVVKELGIRLKEYDTKKNVAEFEKNKLDTLRLKLETAIKAKNDIDKKHFNELKDAREIVDEYDIDNLLEIQKSINEYQKNASRVATLTETKKAEQYKFDTLNDTLKRLLDEYEAHKDGKCHVCGGDYVDEIKHQKLHQRIESLKESINECVERINKINLEMDEIVIDDRAKDHDSQKIDYLISLYQDAKRMIDAPFVNEMDSQIRFLEGEIDQIKLPDIHDLDELLSGVEYDLSIHEAEMESIEQQLSAYGVSTKRELDRLIDDLDSISEKLEQCRKRSNSFSDEVSTLTGRYVPVDEIKAAVEDYRKRETHIGYLIKLMTDSKSFVRKKILDNYIPYLNKKINEYSEMVGLSHVCEISNDLTVEILYMNRPVSYFLMSRGERMRLDMSITRAFRDMMGMLGKGCNLVMVDEALDSSLDIAGASAAAKFLKETASDVLVVTHRDDITEVMDRKILIVKENGFTTIDNC